LFYEAEKISLKIIIAFHPKHKWATRPPCHRVAIPYQPQEKQLQKTLANFKHDQMV